MQRYRAWGFKGKSDPFHMVNGERAEQNFPNDHDWFKKPHLTKLDSHVPERFAFGLPHNYGKAAGGGSVGVNPDGRPEGERERRASPLMIHVHELGEGSYLAVLIFLPATFTATDQLVLCHPGRKGLVTPQPVPTNWEQVVHDFIGPRLVPSPPPQRRKKNYFSSPLRKAILP